MYRECGEALTVPPAIGGRLFLGAIYAHKKTRRLLTLCSVSNIAAFTVAGSDYFLLATALGACLAFGADFAATLTTAALTAGFVAAGVFAAGDFAAAVTATGLAVLATDFTAAFGEVFALVAAVAFAVVVALTVATFALTLVAFAVVAEGLTALTEVVLLAFTFATLVAISNPFETNKTRAKAQRRNSFSRRN
ncbi:MAG: hypothetical protein WBD31_22145 [Rubripirellula sp.]